MNDSFLPRFLLIILSASHNFTTKNVFFDVTPICNNKKVVLNDILKTNLLNVRDHLLLHAHAAADAAVEAVPLHEDHHKTEGYSDAGDLAALQEGHAADKVSDLKSEVGLEHAGPVLRGTDELARVLRRRPCMYMFSMPDSLPSSLYLLSMPTV